MKKYDKSVFMQISQLCLGPFHLFKDVLKRSFLDIYLTNSFALCNFEKI